MSALAVYESRPTKLRRTRAAMDRIRDAIYATLEADPPMTVRQVFYQLVSRGVIAKSEHEYKSTVVRLLSEMRRERVIPFGWIADNTRWMRKPTTYSGLAQMLHRFSETYRRSLWDNQRSYVEVWLEKDALAGVLYPITAEWDVPLMVTRGYPSLSFLYSAAEQIEAVGKATYLYYLGDHDPSGLDITRAVERDIRGFAPTAEIHFERIAVNVDQIARWNLPTRPTKRTDSRARGFDGESVEVDAIPPATLRDLVKLAIEQHIDDHALRRLEAVEQQERETLVNLAQHVREYEP